MVTAPQCSWGPDSHQGQLRCLVQPLICPGAWRSCWGPRALPLVGFQLAHSLTGLQPLSPLLLSPLGLQTTPGCVALWAVSPGFVLIPFAASVGSCPAAPVSALLPPFSLVCFSFSDFQVFSWDMWLSQRRLCHSGFPVLDPGCSIVFSGEGVKDLLSPYRLRASLLLIFIRADWVVS